MRILLIVLPVDRRVRLPELLGSVDGKQQQWFHIIGVAEGIVAGMAMAIPLSFVAARLLFDVSPLEPATIAFATATALTAALISCYLPARNASRVNPVAALQQE